ncbi:hypothetical protein FQN54_001886 [Arachnomyces sp. PD_36]|nr:hypothetical protein FQN54_001886 [Arachnomyces sp. PD_36]
MASKLLNRSNINPSPAPMDTSVHHQDPFLYLERQSRHIQQHLQVLLDAQSDGLIAGLSGNAPEDVLSNGSSTPTASLVSRPRAPATIPVRQPPKRKVGLRGARRGILKSMNELLTLKEEEHLMIDAQVKDRRNALRVVDNLVGKRQGLEQAISTIQQDPENLQVDALKKESRSLEEDIYELETRLLEKKARHRHVVEEISQIQNSVDSKLSSYTSSLSLLDSDVQKFLRNPQVQPLPAKSANQAPFYTLKPARRTLEMAKEHWRSEQLGLRKRQRGVDSEIAALREGGFVWRSVVSKVADFENMLRKEMNDLQTQSQLLDSHKPSSGPSDSSRVRTILKEMNNTSDFLEAKLSLSEEKDWKLLVCCITAELEAFREAKTVLLGSLQLPDDEGEVLPDHSPVRSEDEDHSNSVSDPLGDEDPSEPPADLLVDADRASFSGEAAARPEDQDEDDEPDPAWLLSDS